jgi:hypothetical protein
MMDWTWATALSPIAVVVVGFWLKRLGDDRTARILAVTQRTAAEAQAKLNAIETKVDGRLTKAVDDLASANAAITKLSVDSADFQGRLLRLLDSPSDIAGAKRAIVAEGQPDAMAVDYTEKG